MYERKPICPFCGASPKKIGLAKHWGKYCPALKEEREKALKEEREKAQGKGNAINK